MTAGYSGRQSHRLPDRSIFLQSTLRTATVCISLHPRTGTELPAYTSRKMAAPRGRREDLSTLALCSFLPLRRTSGRRGSRCRSTRADPGSVSLIASIISTRSAASTPSTMPDGIYTAPAVTGKSAELLRPDFGSDRIVTVQTSAEDQLPGETERNVATRPLCDNILCGILPRLALSLSPAVAVR